MSLHRLSVAQAIDVWGDLCRAYYGDHPYGSNVAEIYAYRIMPFQPSLHIPTAEGGSHWGSMRTADARAAARQNAEAMVGLLGAFRDAFGASIRVRGESFDWEPLCDRLKERGFHHRWHIEISEAVP